MPPDLRRVLRDAAPQPTGSLDLEQAMSRGRVLAWRRRAAVAFLTLATTGTAAIIAVVVAAQPDTIAPLPIGGGGIDGSAGPSPDCRGAPDVRESQGAYGTYLSEALTPVVKVASGESGGWDWSLCAYRAALTRNEEAPAETLCEEFRFGPGPGSNYSCVNVGSTAPRDADYFLRSYDPSGEVTQAFFGAVSDRVDRVVIELDNDTETEATILQPAPELGVDYRFFVGFTPSGLDATVSVRDSSGDELEHETFAATEVGGGLGPTVDPADPCSLLSTEEVAKALGLEVDSARENGSLSGSHIRLCGYKTRAPYGWVTLGIESPVGPAEFQQRLEGDSAKATELERIGDGAFVSSGVELSTLVDETVVTFSVKNFKEVAAAQVVLRRLAEAAIKKL